MKNINVLSSLSVFIVFIILGCNEKSTEPKDVITAKPVVKKSSVNFTAQSFNTLFPDSITLKNISTAYSNNYSEALWENLLEYMKGEVTKLGEDVTVFDNVLSQTRCKLSGEYLLPTYAERAKYEGKEVWLLQITYGLGEPNFAHYKCFAISVVNLDTLAYVGCR